MAIYTVGRRRVMVALLLTSILVLTLDLRGYAVLDRARDAFGVAMDPVDTAAEVVANPFRRLWNSYSNYDELERENEILQERVDELIGTLAAAEASVVEYNQLLELNDLPSLAGIPTEKAEVVGASANNFDQIIEINKGSLDRVAVGMPVVNFAGLIGRVINVNLNSAQVRLITDPQFAAPVEVLGGTGAMGDDEETQTTTPSGLTPDEVAQRQESATSVSGDGDETTTDATTPGDGTVDPDAPTTTTALDVLETGFTLPEGDPTAGSSVPDGTGEPDDSTPSTSEPEEELLPAIPADGSPPQTTVDSTTTTTTLPEDPPQLEKEFGSLEGRGQGRLPQIRFVQDNPSLAILQEGDRVVTAGGAESLSPPDIPIGVVVNRADRPGVAGPILEVELNANLEKLNFVQVVLFRSTTDVEQ